MYIYILLYPILEGTKISYLGKRKIIFKSTFGRGHDSLQEIQHDEISHNQNLLHNIKLLVTIISWYLRKWQWPHGPIYSERNQKGDMQRFWPHLRSKRRCISGPNGFRCRRNRRGAAPVGFEGTGEVVSASSSVSGSVGNFSRRERSTRGELGGSAPLGSLKATATDCDRKGVSGVWPPTWAKCLENPQPLTRPWTMTAPGRTANSKRICRAFGLETQVSILGLSL